ncbi:DMT family transporter [Aliishimia ponticola]|uniref:DMT family transporter n=1 Tax=Aliishimia ponticola TaxID=2499833 RepID=A0A4S4NA84_9RHOB|nr:DMT family transporter [Aliishimia ponticola]THH36206.1 DMT family transporter [Aliishimia ponticola]
MSSSLKGVLFALAGYASFSAHDAVIKYLGGSYAPAQILFFSVIFSFPFATVMMMGDRKAGTLRPVNPGWVAVRTIAVTVTTLSAFYAFTQLPLAQVYAFIFAAPLLITILSIPILGERVGIHRWVAVMIGLAGVLIVLRPGAEALTAGHIAGLVAAAGSATVSVITRKIGREERAAVLMLYPMVTNVILMGAVLPFVYNPVPLGDLARFGVIAALGFTGGLCVIAAYRHADAALVAPMQYSQIIWGAGFGFLIFNEVPDRYTGLGAAVIIFSGLYVVIRESLGGKSTNTPVLRTRTRTGAASSPNVGAFVRGRTFGDITAQNPLANAGEGQ